MKFDVNFDKTYPNSIDEVWEALTDREALGEWLMETDFVEEVGHSFRMWCDDGDGGTDTYLCEVLELEKHKRMLWSWLLDEKQDRGETYVEFTLIPVDGGTRLTIRHRGDRDPEVVENFKNGWPTKIERLDQLLSRD